MYSNTDKDIIRGLANRYAEMTNGYENRAKLSRWRALNNLQSERPLVFTNVHLLGPDIDPHLPEQKVENQELREVERWFHNALWRSELQDDRYFDPWFTIRAEMFEQPEGLWGIKPKMVKDESSRGYREFPVLERMEDLDALKATPHRILNPDPPLAQALEDIFGDILPVHRNRVSIYHIWNSVLGPSAGGLFGLEELLMALYTEPEMIHRFMKFCSEAIIKNFKECEESGDWSTADYWYYNTPPNCEDLPDPKANSYGAEMKELTGFGHGQEFDAVSPEMFKEFLLDYQRPILDLFGRVSYGCCDTLDNKLEILSTIPNLTKITAGPLADPSRYPELFAKKAVISWRPITTLMASFSFDEDALRKIIRDGLEKLKGCQVEIHLHDLMTVCGDVSRIYRWAEIASEEAVRATEIGD